MLYQIAKEFAEYFERKYSKEKKIEFGYEGSYVIPKFNKQQFLKDCGV